MRIILVKNRIIFAIIIMLAKGTEILVHENIFLLTEIYIFRKINKILSKYRRAKKTCVRQEGVFIVENSRDIITQKDTEEQV
jgi:hypothetical protein